MPHRQPRAVKAGVPGLAIGRIEVARADDNDSLFVVSEERGFEREHAEVCLVGRPPILIEDDERFETSDMAQTVAGDIVKTCG